MSWIISNRISAEDPDTGQSCTARWRRSVA
jgi:hypothetical protein